MMPTEKAKEEFDQIAYNYLKKYDEIVDVGCGEGRFIGLDPSKIRGVDANPETVKNCLEKGYMVVEGDARELPFGDEEVQALHCSHLIEHFFPEDVHKILSEIDRVLKVGGTFVVRSPLLYDGFYSDLTHIRPYNPQAIMSYFASNSQKTMNIINPNYREVAVEWRYDPIGGAGIVGKFANLIIKNICPSTRRNGYLLVMEKTGQ